MMRRLLVVALLIGAGLVWYVLRDGVSLEHIAERERTLRDFIEARPWQAFAIGFWLYVVVSILPGTTGKSVVAAWLLGFWQALLMVIGALTIAGVIGFSAARYLFRDRLRGFLGYRLTAMARVLERNGEISLLTLRLLHVPFTFVNYVSGVSTVKLWTFIWTTVVGLVPGTVVLVGLGAGLPSLSDLREQGAISLISPVLLAALLAMALVPWIIRWVLRKLRRSEAGDGELTHGGAAPGL
jgi:uncharacterized membrane protein YdjX (TVP38/TMEM64 family)